MGRVGGRARIAGGGLGIGGLLVILILSAVLGVNPLTLLEGLDGGGQPVTADRPVSAEDEELARFVRVVLADTEDTWNALFERAFKEAYEEPRLVLFRGETRSACGYAQSATGPFYCPGDRQVYIDLAFYDELRRRFDAPGDFAQAYVIAHEVGHHVQNLLGILPKFNQMRQRLSQTEANQLSVLVELQADCFAGIWAHDTADKGLLEAGDIDEALNAAAQIGDDAIQRRTQGYVVPESFNHGTSAQRQQWFRRGYDSGRIDECDTFN